MFFLKSIKTGPDFVPVRQSLSFIWFLSLRTFSVIVDHLAFCWSNLFQPLASLCLRSFVLSIFSLLFHLTFSLGSSVAPPPFYPRPPLSRPSPISADCAHSGPVRRSKWARRISLRLGLPLISIYMTSPRGHKNDSGFLLPQKKSACSCSDLAIIFRETSICQAHFSGKG